MSDVWLLLAAYLVGGIPFAYLVVRAVFRTDLRSHGSGNPGATNASRMWSRRRDRLVAFLVILALDMGKGYLACGLLPGLFRGHAPWAPAGAGVAAVLGHTWSPYLGLRGGKGVATTLGVFLALDFRATLIAIVAFAIVFLLTRMVAAGSLALAAALPLAVFFGGRSSAVVGWLAVTLAVLIVVRHRGNIRRMFRGSEPAVGGET